jgi:hypothetical protein
VKRPQAAFACFALGLLLVLLVEASIGRILGVPLMFLGLALAVGVIASPDFLEGDRDV